jgi:hypothetical protein
MSATASKATSDRLFHRRGRRLMRSLNDWNNGTETLENTL